MIARRIRHCGICASTGHDMRMCPRREEHDRERAERDARERELRGQLAREIAIVYARLIRDVPPGVWRRVILDAINLLGSAGTPRATLSSADAGPLYAALDGIARELDALEKAKQAAAEQAEGATYREVVTTWARSRGSA